MTDTIAAPAITPSAVASMDSDSFAAWAFTPKDDAAPAAEAEAPAADVDETSVDDATADAPTDAEGAEAEATEEKVEAEVKPEVPDVKLPFTVKGADDAEIPGATLQDMKVTLKANGKIETLALADVVRRAQSEPAVQQQLRTERSAKTELQRDNDQKAADIAALRTMIFKVVRDDEARNKLAMEIDEHDAPEKRAERAEAQLAADREGREQQAARDAEQAQIQSFANDTIFPTLASMRTQYPLVSAHEILGKFNADTAEITVNGVIPPEYHDQVAAYFNGPLMEFAAARQSELHGLGQTKRDADAKAASDRQREKNAAASASKPAAVTAPGTSAPKPDAKPTTRQEAESSLMKTLLAGL